MDSESRDRGSVTESKGAGWKWIPQQGVYLWWDGERYTRRAEWDGQAWTYTQLPAVRTRTSKESWFIAAWFVALTGLGFLTLFAGGLLSSKSGAECDLDQQLNLWSFLVLWLGGIAVAVFGAATLERRMGATTEALLLFIGAAVLPLMMLLGAAMNCSNY